MHPAGFEPAIPAIERLQTHVLDRLAPGIGFLIFFTSILQHSQMNSHSTCLGDIFSFHPPPQYSVSGLRIYTLNLSFVILKIRLPCCVLIM